MRPKPNDIDEYLATVDAPKRAALRKTWKTTRRRRARFISTRGPK
jgi:hypothetical protein